MLLPLSRGVLTGYVVGRHYLAGDATTMSKVKDAFIQRIRELEEKLHLVVLIHYSCESFYDVKKGSPTIVSIAIMDFLGGQVTTCALCDYPDEQSMLSTYFKFLEENKDRLFVHWNMNDSVYGFAAIENRYTQLTGENPFRLPREQMFDLDSLVQVKHGKQYVDHPKLWNLAVLNRYSTLGFKAGKEEAELFKQGCYFENKLSTIRKIHVLADILADLLSDRLLTRERRIQIIIRRVEENLLYKTIVIIAAFASVVSLILWLIFR
jgi:hypothetical protein